MDIRRLLRASTCPFATKLHLAHPSLLHAYSSTRQVVSRGCFSYPISMEASTSRQSSTLHPLRYRVSRGRGLDQFQTFTFHSRAMQRNQHRTLRPSLMNWRHRQGIKATASSSSHPLTALSPSAAATGALTMARSSARSRGTDAAQLSSSTSTRARAMASGLVTASVSKPNNTASSSTFTRISKASNPEKWARIGRKQRHLVAMHRHRVQRQFKQMQLSTPQHSSQLLGLNGNSRRLFISKSRLVRMSKRRHSRRYAWRSTASSSLAASPLSEAAMAASEKWSLSSRTDSIMHPSRAGAGGGGGGGRGDPRQRYLHIHYHHNQSYRRRIRFLGFQHFLQHSKMYSLRGQRAYQRSMRAYQQVMALRQKNAKFAWYQPFVKDHRKILEDLQQQIDKGDAQEALRLAKILMRAKQRGARLPDGIQLLKLVRMDREHYERRMMMSVTQSARLNSATLQDSSLQMEQLPYLVRLSTKDYNTILERCIDLKDWGNGIKIARILQKRYSAEAFDFYASKTNKDAPNTRTIHLLLAMFVRCQSPVNASKVLKLMHNRYPHPIPVDVYTAFVSELSTVPGQISTIESVIEYMREHGPAPTTTVYNPLLRAKAIQEGIESAEAVVKKMMRLGYSADQQSFRILIDGSLKALDMGRAHHWLAEYRRQGFKVRPDALESFMQTCIQQVLRRCTNTARHLRHSIRNHSSDLKFLEPASGTLDTVEDGGAHPQEWMYKALQVIQYMSSQRIPPTAKTFELLIEGFLCQQNIYEAKRVLKMMRGSPHLYTPAPRTWSLFFEHYLATDDHEAAIRVLSEMRRAMSTQPLAGAISVPPTKHYHQLFRHLLQRNKVSLAERSLYEMMLHQSRAHPSEKEVVDLIWKLDRYPEAAERVYELLYSQIAPSTPALTLAMPTTTMTVTEEKEQEVSSVLYDSGTNRQDRAGAVATADTDVVYHNHILQRGPIQMANVGVMRAKANAKNPLLQGEVWKSWNSMTQRFVDQYSSQALLDDERQRQRLALRKENDLSVMALAFEQVVKAMTKVSSSSSIPTVDQQQQQQRLRHKSSHGDWPVLSSANGGGLDGVGKDRMPDGWDFSQIRQSLGGAGASFGSGLGLSNAGAGIVPFSFAGVSGGSSSSPSSSSAAAVVATAASSIKSKNRMLIQQLLRRRQFLQPLLERGDVVNESATGDIDGHEDIRLEHLKRCFAWVEEHKVPIRIEGLNGYLASLISHGDFSAARESIERVLLSSSSSPSFSSSSSNTSRSRLLPDVNTVQILHEYRMGGLTSGAETQGACLVERVLRAGGPDLMKEWTTYLRNSERRRRGTITTTNMAGDGKSDGARSPAAFV